MENKEKKKSVEARKKIICDLVRDPVYVPMKEKELAVFLQVAREDREDLRGILQELLAEGKLTLTAKGKYVKSNGRFLTGTFVSNARGFGFVEIEGREEDLYIPEAPFIKTRWKWPCFRRVKADARRGKLYAS